MAENKTAYEDTTATTQKGQSHIKKVLNNINNKFSSSSSSPPKMNTTTSSNSNTGTIKTHALKHSTGNINSGQNRVTTTSSSDNKHHHHHQHHHHHHHNNPYVIHKTTSESIRLSTDLSGNNSNSNNLSSSSSSNTSISNMSNNSNMSTGNMTVHQLHLSTAPLAASMRKPKASSFQITSVTVGNKLSADNGEDSADDLDESHTDDNSRVTDFENETPSVSEDTFSKEDVFFSSNALGTAPVIPTSSQYGLVIVDPELGGVGSGQNLQNVHVSVMDAGINIVGPGGCSKLGDVDQKELQHRNERFKVVKIESTEPFKRGRWVCMDYLDHTTLQQRNNENSNNNEKLNHCNSTGDDSNGDDGGGNGAGGGTSDTALTNDSGVNVSENHMDSVGESSDGNTQQQINFHNSPGQTMKHPGTIPTISSSNPNSSGAGSSGGPIDMQNLNGISNVASIHAQNMQHVPNVVSSQPSLMMSATSVNAQNAINAVGQMSGTIQQQIPPVNEIILPPLNTETTNYVPGQSQPQIYLNQQQQQQNTVQQVHGATLPANMQMQNGIPNLTSTQQQQQQHQQSQSSLPQVISSINVSMPIVVPSSNNNVTTVEAHNINMPSSQPIIMQQPIQHPQSINQQQQSINNQTVQNQSQQDMYVQSQSSAPQSYSGNTVTSNLITSGAIQQQEIHQQIDNQQLNITNQALQSGIVSPSSIGGVMTSNVDTIQHHQINNIAGQSLPNVKIPDMIVQQTSAPSTINEAAVIISNSIQAQQTHGQNQQSGSEDSNQQTQPMETDSERVSRLTLTLNKSKNHPISTNSMITSEPPKSLLTSFVNDVNKEKIRYNNNSFTNLALGNSMNRILGSSSKYNQFNKIIKDKSQSDLSMMNENGGIPIPIRQQNTNDTQTIMYSSNPDNSLSSYGYSNNLISVQQPKISVSYENFKNDKISSNQMNCITLPSINLNMKARRASAFSSASGASAVAIDNKIEQAMDLVKSHLMIAVREEVEVLKEKIAELMDRINQLEVENTILKANVSQETLNQLQLQGSVQSVQSTSTPQTTTNNTSAVPTVTNTSNGLVP